MLTYKMWYSIKPSDQIYVEGYGFSSATKNIGNSLSSKSGEKIFDSNKKINNKCSQTLSKREIQRAKW